MKTSFTVVIRDQSGKFITPDRPNELLAIRPVEAWFYGSPDTIQERTLKDQAAICCSRLPVHLIHHVKLSPIQDFSEIATPAEARAMMKETLTLIHQQP